MSKPLWVRLHILFTHPDKRNSPHVCRYGGWGGRTRRGEYNRNQHAFSSCWAPVQDARPSPAVVWSAGWDRLPHIRERERERARASERMSQWHCTNADESNADFSVVPHYFPQILERLVDGGLISWMSGTVVTLFYFLCVVVHGSWRMISNVDQIQSAMYRIN